jgi:hypothetical protein
MAQSLDTIAARILGRVYSDDPNDLAREIAAGLSALSRQPSFSRGLARDVLADVQGGTTLGVGDPGATNISGGLVQNPQTGLPRNVGSGLRVRRQSRIEVRTRDCPAIVTETATGGATSVSVKIVGTGTVKRRDTLTQSEVVGDPLATLVDNGTDSSSVVGTEMEASTTGTAFVNAGENGIQPPVAGQTIMVTLSEQWEVTTTWTNRYRKNLPCVTRVLKSTTATVTNGLVNVLT